MLLVRVFIVGLKLVFGQVFNVSISRDDFWCRFDAGIGPYSNRLHI